MFMLLKLLMISLISLIMACGKGEKHQSTPANKFPTPAVKILRYYKNLTTFVYEYQPLSVSDIIFFDFQHSKKISAKDVLTMGDSPYQLSTFASCQIQGRTKSWSYSTPKYFVTMKQLLGEKIYFSIIKKEKLAACEIEIVLTDSFGSTKTLFLARHVEYNSAYD